MAYDSSHIQFADSKSMYMAVLKLAGGPITIKCSKHDFVLNSTPYSEYVAMSVAVQTNDWFCYDRSELANRIPCLLPITKVAATASEAHWRRVSATLMAEVEAMLLDAACGELGTATVVSTIFAPNTPAIPRRRGAKSKQRPRSL
jgi:hypothetical protein